MSKQSVDRRALLKATGVAAVFGVPTSGVGATHASSSAVAAEELVPPDDISIVSPSLFDPDKPGVFVRGDIIPITLSFEGGNVGTISLPSDLGVEAHVTVHDADASGEVTLYLNTYQFGDENRNHGFFTHPDDDGVELIGDAEANTQIDGGSAGGAVISGGDSESAVRYDISVSPGTEPHTAENSGRTNIVSFEIDDRATDEYTFWTTATTPEDLAIETVPEFEDAIDNGRFHALDDEVPEGGVLAIDVAASGLEGILHEAAIRDEELVVADVLARTNDNLVTNPFLAATEQTIDGTPLLMADLESTEVGTGMPVELDLLPGVVDVVGGRDEFDRLDRYVLLVEMSAGSELVTEGGALEPGQTFDTTVSVEPSGGELEGHEEFSPPLSSDSSAFVEGWTLVSGAEFAVTTTEPADPIVEQGEELSISGEIENVGDTTGTIDVMLEIGDVTDTQSVTVDDGATDTFEFTVNTELLAPAEYDYTITTPTDEAINTVTIGQPAELLLSDLNPAETTVEQGSSVSVTATVENVGDVPATGEVSFSVGDIEEVIQVDLDGGETDTIEFTVEPEMLTPDEYTHRLETDHDEVTGTLVVEAATDDSDEDDTDPGDGDDDTETTDDEDTDDADDDGPGFGVGAALAGLGTAGYLLKRRGTDDRI